jgi:6-phosphofructokinase 1
LAENVGDQLPHYVSDETRVRVHAEFGNGSNPEPNLAFEKAGPRRAIFFQPAQTRLAVVTCGGLCPGTNAVIRSIVLEAHFKYGVPSLLGYRYGFHGMNQTQGIPPMALSLDAVRDIHREGGSILGMSRGAEEATVLVDTLVRDGVNALLCIGGDGTMRGAHAIFEEVRRRGLSIGVIGIPKTIDNDVNYVDKTFGYETAVEVARLAIDAAHTEARGALNGVGLVKLMGRDSGFITCAASLASRDVNFCLIPEVEWELEGEHGLLSRLRQRVAERRHAVIAIAEGCGRMLVDEKSERDASGNVRYGADDADIGVRLRDAIAKDFKARSMPLSLKYIDPSYMIRSVPPNAADSIFCDQLARCAVHAAMAGKTDVVIGQWFGVTTHVPIPIATAQRKQVDPHGALWLAVTVATGQPRLIHRPPVEPVTT